MNNLIKKLIRDFWSKRSVLVLSLCLGLHACSSSFNINNHIGKWHDAPSDMPLWYICEQKVDDNPAPKWQVFQGNRYRLFKEVATFKDAEKQCALENAYLTTIHSAQENDFVQSLAGWDTVWIGLSESEGTEQWLWADDSPLEYNNWESGQPNNDHGRDEDAGMMSWWVHMGMSPPFSMIQGNWNDISASSSMAYVCESHSNKEQQLGWVNFNKAFYLFNKKSVTYSAAQAACAEHSADLVSIGSAEENRFVADLCEDDVCWIGLYRQDNANFSWSNGEALHYSQWGWGEPNNLGDKQNAAHIWGNKQNSLIFVMRLMFEGKSWKNKWPLHYAAMTGDSESIKQLSQSTDPNLKMTDWHDSLPLGWAASLGHLEAVKTLVSVGADPSPSPNKAGMTPLIDAKRMRVTEVIEYLENLEKER